jgi:hypothetical protein
VIPPNTAGHVINFATRSPLPARGDGQAERAERLERARSERALRAAQIVLQASLAHLLAAARRYRDNADSQDHFDEKEKALNLENLELEGGGVSGLVAAFFVAVMWLAIGAIDAALLAGVSHLMIGLVYVTPEGPRWWMVLTAVAAILLLEIGLATRIALATRGSAQGGQSARRWRWLGIVLAVVVPALGIATLLTALAAGTFGLSATQNLLLVFGFAALAVVCHASVIFGGESALNAYARLLYGPRRWGLRRQVRKHGLAALAAQDATRDAILAFEAELNRYREAHGEPPRHLLIQGRDAELVNRAAGEPVVALPVEGATAGADAPAAGDDGQEGSAPPVPADDGGPTTPVVAASAAPPVAEADGASSAEAEYLRGVLGARQRDADGEVGR